MENVKVMSILLCEALDFIIGTKKIVDGRRKGIQINNSFLNLSLDSSETTIPCGSRAEGFYFPSGDLDFMSYQNHIHVVDNDMPLHDKFTLRMIYDVNHPGSVLLEPLTCVNELTHPCNCVSKLTNQCIKYRGRIVVSSEMMLTAEISSMSVQMNVTRNGPCGCISMRGLISTDKCFAFKCSQCPGLTSEFIHRKRRYGWPSPDVIIDIAKHGCYCVPIGDGTSTNSFLQWRISFAPAEVKLVHTLSHLELKVYALMKICCQDIFKKILGERDGKPLLCSYCMKTIIFTMKENSPCSVWTDTNLLSCFWMCFNFLIDSVEKGFLCHFFIPGNNLFRKRVYGKSRQTLLQLLYTLRRKGPGFVYECSTLRPFSLRYLTFMTPTLEELRINCEVFFSWGTDNGIEFSPIRWISALHFLNHSRKDLDLYLSLCLIQKLLLIKASECLTSVSESVSDNKTIYYRRRMCRHYLLFTTNLDVSQGWLTLATYHYLIGQYKQAITICQHVKMSFKPWTIINGVCTNEAAFVNRFCGQEMSVLNKMREVISNHFVATTDNQLLYPAEIIPEITFSNLYLPARIHPKPYASFLSFLCYYHIKDRDGEQNELSELLALQMVDTERAISKDPWYMLLFNLIGICYELLGDYQSAERNYLASARREHLGSSVARFRLSNLRRFRDGNN